MKPPRSILDPTFAYTPASHTDIRKTFARVRAEQAQNISATKIRFIPLKPKECK